MMNIMYKLLPGIVFFLLSGGFAHAVTYIEPISLDTKIHVLCHPLEEPAKKECKSQAEQIHTIISNFCEGTLSDKKQSCIEYVRYVTQLSEPEQVVCNKNNYEQFIYLDDLSSAPYCELMSVDFSGKTLNKANFRSAFLYSANFEGASLISAELYKANMIQSNLNKAVMMKANFSEVDLTTALGEGANFTRAVLVSATMIASAMPNAIFDRAHLNGADLRGANLESASFVGATATTANFEGAILKNTDWTGANLAGASFNGANLSGANFTGANVKLADFTSATLTNKTIFQGAKGLASAKFPKKWLKAKANE